MAAFNNDEFARTCTACGSRHSQTSGFASAIPSDRALEPEPNLSVRRRSASEALAEVAELQTGLPLLVEVDGVPIALQSVGHVVNAVANLCPHKAGPLGLGEIRNGAIICPWHHFRFNLTSGRSVTDPDLVATVYPVDIRDGAIFLATSTGK